MRVHHGSAPIWLRAAAVIAVGIAVAASGCTTGRPSEPPSSTGTSSTPPESEEAIVARIRLPVSPFSVATGEGWVWALTRQPAAAVWRIDPNTNRPVGTPIRLPVDPWHIAVGAGSVWVTPNGADGRLLRIDPRTGQISAHISARPIYFGSVLAFGAGFVWTGNDDERYQQGSTVSKLDPATNQVIGEPLALGSPQSIAFGHGALWVADHAGWLVKIDPTSFRVVARRRLDFGPHGVVVTDGAVYVADAHGSRLLEADPNTARIRRVAPLPIGPIYPAVGAGSIWSSSAAGWGDQATRDDRVVRIDPRTLAVVDTFHLGGAVSAVAFGYGSLWATVQTGQLVRITPKHNR
jgi:DNA-binding beta-propeller fold protein YncE